MDSNYSLFSIQKLTGRENYYTWQFAVKSYLQQEGLWECVEGSEKDIKKENKARTKIILLVDPVIYVHIEEAKTAKQVWENLSHVFDDSGLTRREGSLKDLRMITLTGCQNEKDDVSKIMSTAQKLSNHGLKVDNEWLRTMLLSGLPEQSEPMMMAYSGLQVDNEWLRTMLLSGLPEQCEPTMKAVESSGIPITSNAMRAPVLQDVTDENDTKAFTANKGSRSSYAAVFLASQNVKDDRSWFVDSGAPCHMTKHEEWLQEVMTSPTKMIKVANDDILHVKSCGQISLEVIDEKGQRNKVLCKNVLYVPELATNVLSVSQIIKTGGQVKFNGEGCVILNKLNTVVATASLVNNMYRLSTAEADACISDIDKQDAYVWHQRMGHLNFPDLEKLNDCTEGAVFRKQVDVPCLTCLEGKQTRLPFNHEGTRATQLLELVHSDLCGPMETTSLGGASYFLTLTDDFSRKVFVYALRSKEQVLEKFKEFRNESENLLGRKIKCLRTDNGTEFVNEKFSQYLRRAGIIHQINVPYMAQNKIGLAERMNRALVEKAKCMLRNAKLNKYFWAEALLTAAHVYNRSPSRTLSFKTPEEVWKGTKQSVSHLRIFGCEAMVHTPQEKAKKWDAKARKMIFIGYCEQSTSYRFIIPNTRTVVKSRDAVFVESSMERNCVPVKLTELSNEIDSIDDSCNKTSSSIQTARQLDSVEKSDYLSAESLDSPRMVVRSKNQVSSSKPNRKEEISYLSVEEESVSITPEIYIEAVTSADAEKFKNAPDLKFVGCKWMFPSKDEISSLRYKTRPCAIPSKDEISSLRYKTRLCAKGYLQQAGTDYNETFSPTVRYDSIRLLLSSTVQQNNHFIQIDVKTAFPYGVLQERIFTSTVLEGLKTTFTHGVLQERTFTSTVMEGLKTVFPYSIHQERIFTSTVLESLKTEPNVVCKVVKSLYGLKQSPRHGNEETENVDQLLNKFNMTDANPNSVPADPHLMLKKCEALSETSICYREAVGFLTHAATVSRPDIIFAVSLVSRFLNNYYESRWNDVKNTSKYLKATKSYERCYQHIENDDLVEYDADNASYVESSRFVYDRGKMYGPPRRY